MDKSVRSATKRRRRHYRTDPDDRTVDIITDSSHGSRIPGPAGAPITITSRIGKRSRKNKDKDKTRARGVDMENSGKPACDDEAIALGSLEKDQWFRIPVEFELEMCEPRNMLMGTGYFPVRLGAIAAIYALAKEQFAGNPEAIRIAALRMEAFIAGWFDNQIMVERHPCPRNAVFTLAQDVITHKEDFETAYSLCAFLPFIHELSYRTTASTYNSANRAKYIEKVKSIAKKTNHAHLLNYLSEDALYSTSLRWIGVKRVREILTLKPEHVGIPNPFRLRSNAAPAGCAIITTGAAVINSLTAAGLWGEIVEAGGFDADLITRVADQIRESPFKFHMYAAPYAVDPPSEEEKKHVKAAAQLGASLSPIFQAWITVTQAKGSLAGARVFRGKSNKNKHMYNRALALFRAYNRHVPSNIKELFAPNIKELFAPSDIKELFASLFKKPAGDGAGTSAARLTIR